MSRKAKVKYFVISSDNLPSRPVVPVLFTAVAWLFLDRFKVSGVPLGVAYSIIVLGWIGVLTRAGQTEEIDVFKAPIMPGIDGRNNKNDIR